MCYFNWLFSTAMAIGSTLLHPKPLPEVHEPLMCHPTGSQHFLSGTVPNILLLSPGGHTGLVHNTQTPGTLSCNGNLLCPKYKITDRNLGKSLSLWAAKSTYKALTHCIPVAWCLNKLCWKPAITAGRGVIFLSLQQQAVNCESQW